MSRAEVWAELSHARASVTPAQDRHLHALGIPTEARLMCGTARIQPEGKFYQPDDGIMAVITPIIDGGEVVDLLAWNTDCPARWWTRTGAHWALGADALDRLWLGDRLKVFRSPRSWLQAGAPYNAVMVLDWDIARLHIPRVEIVAEDLEHGLELDRLLCIPAQHPLISVPARAAA